MISIILCTYNRAPLLPRAINSVLKQTCVDWELIVVDDGSVDATRSLVKSYTQKEKRIRYFFQPNAGLAEARNAGIRLASGELLCFLDSDDEIAPSHLDRRMKYLQHHGNVDFLHGGMRLIGPKKRQYVVNLDSPKRKIHLSKCHVGGTFFFRRKILRRVKTFRAIPFGEDFDFYRRVEKYFTIRKVPFPTYRYHLETENRLCDVFTEELMKKE